MSDKQTASDGGSSGGDRAGNPIKEMFLLAALYLPLGFFLWFFAASIVVFPAARLSEWVMTGLFPDLFEAVKQFGFRLEIQTLVRMQQEVQGRVALLNLEINPMIYAWGIPLLFGLVMATPLTARQRLIQCAIGFPVIILIQVWGIFWESFKDMAFLMGPEAARAVAESPLSTQVIALCYQLGYLILPAVTPIVLWILMNRAFLEQVVFRRPR